MAKGQENFRFLVLLAVVVAPCPTASAAPEPAPGARAADVRLVPVPRSVVGACREAQRQVRFTVLCPSLLPRPSRGSFAGIEPLALGGVAFRGGLVDIGYNAEGDTGGSPLSFNSPERFLHFEIGLADQGIPTNARPARLGGRSGLLAPATPGTYAGPYFANHVRFLFRERRHQYVATLHTFGERATERLLDRILRTLRPARDLEPPPPPATAAFSIPVGDGPSSVLLRDGSLWVVDRGTLESPNPLANHLARIDPSTGKATRVRGLGVRPIEIAAGDDAIWATHTHNAPSGNYAPPELARIDPESARVTGRLRPSEDERDAATTIAATKDAVWVGLTRFGRGAHERGTVVRVDPGTLEPVARVPVGRRPVALALDGERLWVVNAAANTVSVIDTSTNRVTATIRVGQWPSSIAITSGSVWVANARDGTVSRIDFRTGRVSATIPIGGPAYSLAVTGESVWAALPGRGSLVEIDPATNAVAREIFVGGDPLGIAADGDTLWVTMTSDGMLVRVPVG